MVCSEELSAMHVYNMHINLEGNNQGPGCRINDFCLKELESIVCRERLLCKHATAHLVGGTELLKL